MKTKELYINLQKALIKFEEALAFEDTEPLRESLIQRFEYTFELAWKLMSSILKDQGIQSYGVKNILRDAAKMNLIENIKEWFKYANARNLTSHIYLEAIAIDVATTAKQNFRENIQALLDKASEQINSFGD